MNVRRTVQWRGTLNEQQQQHNNNNRQQRQQQHMRYPRDSKKWICFCDLCEDGKNKREKSCALKTDWKITEKESSFHFHLTIYLSTLHSHSKYFQIKKICNKNRSELAKHIFATNKIMLLLLSAISPVWNISKNKSFKYFSRPKEEEEKEANNNRQDV